MKTFFELIKVSFKQSFQYRWTFFMTVLCQPFLLLINLALFTSIYSYNATNYIKGYSLEQMVWYFTSLSIINCFIWNYTTFQLSNMIITGNLSVELLKPISLFKMRLARAIASRLIALFMDFIPSMILFSIIIFPDFLTLISFSKFLLVVMFAFFLNFLFAFIMGLIAILIKDSTSLFWLFSLCVTIIGGGLIPMEFYPSWLSTLLDFLPFKYIVYWPIQFFLNRDIIDGVSPFLRILSIQLLWVLFLFLVYKLIWKMLIKKFCAAGG